MRKDIMFLSIMNGAMILIVAAMFASGSNYKKGISEASQYMVRGIK